MIMRGRILKKRLNNNTQESQPILISILNPNTNQSSLQYLVRSLTLDVKVWEPSVISLFQSLGNNFANSVWEETLPSISETQFDPGMYESCKPQASFAGRPNQADSTNTMKEKFIHAKYSNKQFVRKTIDDGDMAQELWEAVRLNDKKTVYRIIVSSEVDVNAVYSQRSCKSLSLAKVILLQEQSPRHNHISNTFSKGSPLKLISNLTNESSVIMDGDLEGCSLLHLACQSADIAMLELLLQYGANVNATDSVDETPLFRCILGGNATCVKLLLSRGANLHIVNNEGKTPLEVAVESNLHDDEVLSLLSDLNRQ